MHRTQPNLLTMFNHDRIFSWRPTILDLPDQVRLDESIRLWQNIVQALLLRDLPRHLADTVQPAADRAWFASLAPASGIPTAVGIGLPSASSSSLPPTMTFHPTPDHLAELYLVHRTLRRAGMEDAADDADRRLAELAVLAGVAAEIRRRGLWPAYVRAARLARATLGFGSGAPSAGNEP